jgi:predicted ATPase
LLSLVGAGGIGKTTVAVAVADRLRADLDAVAFVDLAPIENGTQMSAAAATALGINLRLHDDPVDQIAVAVEDRRVLIVLDNREHLGDAAAAFVEALLSSAPGVTILATSRERLRAACEWVHQLSPLEAPPESPTVSAEEVRGYPAVELFEERAAFALGGYQISDTDAPYVVEICRRLDGIALAIELAARPPSRTWCATGCATLRQAAPFSKREDDLQASPRHYALAPFRRHILQFARIRLI